MRLTNDMRDSIIDQEVRNKYHDEKLEIEKEFYDLIKIEADKTVPKIPKELEGYIRTTNDFQLDDKTWRDWSDTFLEYRLDTYYPVKRNCNSEIKIKSTKKIRDIFKKSKKFVNEKHDYRTKLKQVLYSYNTVKKLLLAVPELTDYFKDEMAASCMSLVPVDAINEIRKELKKGKK